MKLFYNLKLAVKISILSVMFLVFLISIGFLGINAVTSESKALKSLNNNRLIPVYTLEEAAKDFKDIRIAVLSHLNTQDKSTKNILEGNILSSEKAMFINIEKYSKTNFTGEDTKGVADFKQAYKEYQDVRGRVISLSNNGKIEEAQKLENSEGSSKFNNVTVAYDHLVYIQIKEAKQLYDNSEKTYKMTIVVFISLIGACILIGIVLSFITIRAIVIPIRRVTLKLNEIANNGGDLTQRIGIKSDDEVGQLSKAFDRFIQKLHVIVKDVAETAQTIATSSQQLSAATSETNKTVEHISITVNDIAQATSENVKVTSKTTLGLNEALHFSEATAKASKKTNENSIKVKEAAEHGAAQVSEIAISMNEIAKSSKAVSMLIQSLDESSHKISKFVNVITNISGQTNLLALNAAIEAARAGEAGRGFSVVAEEIRKLADESSKSAREIVLLVKDNLIKVEEAVKSVNDVDEIVTTGAQTAKGVKVNMDNIIYNIIDVTRQIGQINQDVEKQAIVTEDITKAMNGISENASSMAAGTEEMSATIEEQVSTLEEIEATTYQLAQMAEKLHNITSGFKV